jgi:hypothetical protein
MSDLATATSWDPTAAEPVRDGSVLILVVLASLAYPTRVGETAALNKGSGPWVLSRQGSLPWVRRRPHLSVALVQQLVARTYHIHVRELEALLWQSLTASTEGRLGPVDHPETVASLPETDLKVRGRTR